MKKLFFVFLIPIIVFAIDSCANSKEDTSGALSQMDQTLDQPNATDDEVNPNIPIVAISSCYLLDNSSIDNSTVDNSTITDNSTINNSTVNNCSTVSFSRIASSTVDNSTITRTTVDNSTVSYSTSDNSTIDNSTASKSRVDNSTLYYSIDDNSTFGSSTIRFSTTCFSSIDNSSLDNSTACYATIDNSTIRLTIIDNSTIYHSTTDNNSTIKKSTVTFSTINSSVVDNGSNVCQQSTIDNSTIDNATVCSNSTVTGNSTILNGSSVCNSTIDNSTIDNSTICYGSVAMSISNRNVQNQVMTESVAPTVSSTSPADNATGITLASSVSVTFSEDMDVTSVTTNTANTSCSGTFQVSSDSFSSCVQMSASPTVSNSNQTFSVTPSSSLIALTTYKIIVTTGVMDPSGNLMNSTYTTSNGFTTADVTAPVLAEVTAVTTPTNYNTPSYTFSSTEAGAITYGGSCSSSTSSATTNNNTVTFNLLADQTYDNCTITVTDSSNNASSSLNVNTFIVDTTGPTVTSFTSTTADGSYKSADTVNITATVSETVVSGNTITVILDTGDSILLTAAANGTTLVGTYTVSSADTSSDLTVSSFSIGTVIDIAGNPMTSTTVPATNIATGSAIVIDTTAPTVSSVAITSATGTSPHNVGDIISVTSSFNENVTVTGSPTLTLKVETTGRTAMYSSGSGGTSLVFAYTIIAGDNDDNNGISIDMNALALNGGTIRDTASNDATLTHSAVDNNSDYIVDTPK